ncbi:hypothetical protein H2248_000555 [Termitomyces sp. 'cryptogamus']|nr:hypothetical protein H2248_000541 [Termitomyces sp. 'cryptogamus']KAH0590400.1 hypothetical protein H2248_000555 [Termitomyces sp. 'cryptogamus']
MDLFNRPPTIAEDTLHYTLYLPKDLSDKASATTFAACIRTYVEDVLPGFIWHRDAFELKVVLDSDPENSNAYILEGRMRVGDCVDDEWCTVWLLKKISAKWDIVISVFDSDGEFLLIEAAETLPSWVKPTNSENRVWIYSSRLHLIPISHISPPSRKRHRRQLPGSHEDEDRDHDRMEDDDGYISAQCAIGLVRDPSVPTFAPNAVETMVWQRISGYPNAAKSHVHNTKVYIPSDIALSLMNSPSLIQKAVEAFYTRDAIQLRAAHRMNRFSPNESVLSMITMTRTAYAQLIGQNFFPPKVFGYWSEPEGSKERRWRDVGMKIAVGFEMLYQESKNRTDTSFSATTLADSSAEAKKDALRRNPEYNKYIQNLHSVNYFKGEIEGSELWRSLENKAATMFVEVRKEDDATRPSFAFQVNAALSNSTKTISIPKAEEDPDDWLNMNAQDFETMLEQSISNSQPKSSAQLDAMDVDMPNKVVEDRVVSEQAVKLKELATKVENFIEGEGDLEGAMLEDDTFSDEELSDEETDDGGEEQNDVPDTTARQVAMEKLVPGIDPSDYGKMPASFHSNSQRTTPKIIDTDDSEVVDVETQPSPNKEPGVKPIRQPIIPRDKYDGVDSDDETDEDEVEDESEEDRPQVVGEIEIDMDDEEEEFLEFSRQALGISDDQWNAIIQNRQERGAFLPASVKKSTSQKTTSSTTSPSQIHGRPPASGPRPNVNPNLDSFEAVMQAMDAELSRLRSNSKKGVKVMDPLSVDKVKGKAKATVEDGDGDIESVMEAELRATLERDDEDDEEPPDYNLIKNFLESFKSQAGLSGPVGNLVGMLQPEWQLPRDNS